MTEELTKRRMEQCREEPADGGTDGDANEVADGVGECSSE